MINEHIDQIQSKIASTAHLPEETRKELLDLIDGLKSEIGPLAETHGEDAGSIARFADASTHEAIRSGKNPDRIDAAVAGLRKSVEGFEASHPDLVAVVNRLSIVLSNMGI